MMTFKQLEAIYWVVRLGSFAQAANKLHTTQSAVSKRVQELEALFNTSLFDRSLRSARLTEKGEQMFAVAKRLLEQRDLAVEHFAEPEVVERRLRLGVTEVTAMTWLPRLVGRIQAVYPKVVIEPDVDTGIGLRDKILADELDLAIVGDAFEDPRFTVRLVGTLTLAWMCKPGLIDTRKPVRLHEIAKHRLLLQGTKSGTGLVVDRWLSTLGVKLTASVRTNNVLTMIGMAVSGLGITYLPAHCMQPMVDAGMLALIRVTPAPPQVRYVAMYRAEQRSTLVSSIARLAQESCDFSRMFQAATEVRGEG